MENRVAVISIIIEKNGDIEALNRLLHEYGAYIVGRMGISHPSPEKSAICQTSM